MLILQEFNDLTTDWAAKLHSHLQLGFDIMNSQPALAQEMEPKESMEDEEGGLDMFAPEEEEEDSDGDDDGKNKDHYNPWATHALANAAIRFQVATDYDVAYIVGAIVANFAMAGHGLDYELQVA